MNRALRFLPPPRPTVASRVRPLPPQGECKLNPALCVFVIAEQDSTFREFKDNQGRVSNKCSIVSRGLVKAAISRVNSSFLLEFVVGGRKKKKQKQLPCSSFKCGRATIIMTPRRKTQAKGTKSIKHSTSKNPSYLQHT